jgi:hypothetical protein
MSYPKEIITEVQAEIARTEENLGPEAAVEDYAADVLYRLAFIYFGGAEACDAIAEALDGLKA